MKMDMYIDDCDKRKCEELEDIATVKIIKNSNGIQGKFEFNKALGVYKITVDEKNPFLLASVQRHEYQHFIDILYLKEHLSMLYNEALWLECYAEYWYISEIKSYYAYYRLFLKTNCSAQIRKELQSSILESLIGDLLKDNSFYRLTELITFELNFSDSGTSIFSSPKLDELFFERETLFTFISTHRNVFVDLHFDKVSFSDFSEAATDFIALTENYKKIDNVLPGSEKKQIKFKSNLGNIL